MQANSASAEKRIAHTHAMPMAKAIANIASGIAHKVVSIYSVYFRIFEVLTMHVCWPFVHKDTWH